MPQAGSSACGLPCCQTSMPIAKPARPACWMRCGAERRVLRGDMVGHGGDPVWAVERARGLAAAGAILLKGNHDEAAARRATRPPRMLRPDGPDWLQEAMLRCLHVLPERRHPTAAQRAYDIRHPDQLPLTARAQAEARWLDAAAATPLPSRSPAAFSATREPCRIPGARADPGGGGGHGGRAGDAGCDARHGRTRDADPAWRAGRLPLRAAANLIAPDTTLDEEGRNRHGQALIELKHWAAPPGLDHSRAIFRLLEAVSPASAILEHRQVNAVDRIVLGAGGPCATACSARSPPRWRRKRRAA